MKQFLYIIYSKKASKYYIGETHNCYQRTENHNNHLYKGSFTKIAIDWELVLCFECNNREEALFLEKFIKKNEK